MSRAIEQTSVYRFIFVFTLSVVVFLTSIVACRTSVTDLPVDYISIGGKTMGTTYSIKAQTSIEGLQAKVDSLLMDINHVFSTYDSTSLISELNKSIRQKVCITDTNEYFKSTLEIARETYQKTNGYFDPTVMPLVRHWGFGPNKLNPETNRQIDIDSILQIIGFDKYAWEYNDGKLCVNKLNTKSSIDLNAIAKGKGVDLVAQLLEDLKIVNYMVEIGGEIKAKGKNATNETWKIGIERPVSNTDLSKRLNQAIIELSNQAIASSGNYRNFRQFNGKIIGHTINPLTGYPEMNDLLGVSVIAEDCATADAFATGFMAMGFEKAYAIASKLSTIKVFFVSVIDDGTSIEVETTNGFEESIIYLSN